MVDDSTRKRRWKRIVVLIALSPILILVTLFVLAWIIQWAIDAMVIVHSERKHVVVELDRTSALERKARREMSRLQTSFRDHGVEADVFSLDGVTIGIHGVPESSRLAARRALADQLPGWSIEDESDPWLVTLPAAHEDRIVRSALSRTELILRKRLKAEGARLIRTHDSTPENLRFELTFKILDPGSSSRFVSALAYNSVLEIRLVPVPDNVRNLDDWLPPRNSIDSAIALYAGSAIAEGVEICRQDNTDDGSVVFWPTLSAAIVRGNEFGYATAIDDERHGPELAFGLTDESNERLEAVTSANIGGRMVLVMWDERGCKVLVVQRITVAIDSGIGISGSWQDHELASLIQLARAGWLPARIYISE